MPGCMLVFALMLLSLTGCSEKATQSPEQFALAAAEAVARGDWAAYRPLALAHAAALATESNPTATRGTFASLTSADEDRVRRDFERVVRTGVARPGDIAAYRVVIDATEPDRWHVHVDGAAGPTGLRMTLQRYGESFRVVHLYAGN